MPHISPQSIPDSIASPRPYATHIDVQEGLRVDLFAPDMFRVRQSSLRPEPFPDRFEVPFAVGRMEAWEPVAFTADPSKPVATVRTEAFEIRVLKMTGQFTVWSLDGRQRIYPSTGPVRGMFKDGYTVFDSASALSEQNYNSRHAHWFADRTTGRYDRIFLEEKALLDTFFVYGPGYPELFAKVRELIGPEPMLPRKAYGFFQTQHLAGAGNQTKFMEMARKLREHNIPCDALVLDFEWGDGCDGGKEIPWGAKLDWGSEYTTPLSPREMIREIKDMGYEVLLIHHNAPDLKGPMHEGWVCKYFPEEEWWREWKARMDEGVAGTWQDTRKADISDAHIYLGMESLTSSRPWFFGCRDMWDTCSWNSIGQHLCFDDRIGSRRYPFDWTGDCDSSWQELAWQVEAITNSQGSMKAISYVTSDTRGDDWKVQARWHQFNAFNSVARAHAQFPWEDRLDKAAMEAKTAWYQADALVGSGAGQSDDLSSEASQPPVRTPRTAEESIRRHLQLRYRLLPYLYSTSFETWRSGLPICRPLLLAFPDDPRCNADQWPRQYLFGPDLLVAPVCADVERMPLYFPGPATWICWWTGTAIPGGQEVLWDVSDVERMPLFVRAGAILPLVKQVRDRIDPADCCPEIELHVFDGDNGAFELYEDDGLSLDYRHGQGGITRMEHTRSALGRKVRISAMQGDFPGRVERRSWHVRIHGTRRPGVVLRDGVATQDWKFDADKGVTSIACACGTAEGLEIVVLY